jgi:3-methyladenine DNA glycosylase/8-oxoguanine DNA glycosylase
MKVLFDGSLPECAAPYAGIVQQYIFHYARMTGLKVD